MSLGRFGGVACAALLFACASWADAVNEFDPHHAPGYAPTTWASIHADSSNSDYVPLATATELEEKWRVLEGAGVFTAPSVAPDGMLFVTTGRGARTSHLHKISPAGEILWESPPQASLADLDSGAVTSAPLLGDAGDVYVGDANQFWAFRRDGSRKWVTDLAPLGAEGPFLSSIFMGDAVGGVTIHGQVVLFDRETGALAVPRFDLPGGESPRGPVPSFLWKGGLIDPVTRTKVNEVLMGLRYEVTNTPAVHPKTGRLYLMAGGRSLDEGIFYGIDLVDGALRIAFETPTAPGTGTSPAISFDGERVYAFGGEGEIFAIDATSGEILFERPVGGMPASPSVAPDGSLYLLANAYLRKLDGRDGREIWSRSYDEFAREELPSVSGAWPLVVSGEPVARIDSVVTITANVIWTTLLCGYELRVAGRDLVQPKQTFLVAISPRTGDLLSWYPIPETSEGAISVGFRGELYLDLLSVQASIAARAPYRFLMPLSLRVKPPRGGVVAFAPRSQRSQIALGMDWAARLVGAAGQAGSPARSEYLRLARSQLRATQQSFALARERDEMTDAEHDILGGAVSETRAVIDACREGNVGDYGCAALPAKSRTLQALGGAFH